MKPRLRNGQPVGQYVPRSPADINGPIYLCWCDSCATGGTPLLKLDGSIALGRYFYSEYEIGEHRSENRILEQQADKAVDTVAPNSPSLSLLNNTLVQPVFTPPAPVSTSVSLPIAQEHSSTLPDPTQQPQIPETDLSLQYEWNSLYSIEHHLTDLDKNYLRYWNPTDIQFQGNVLHPYPENTELGSLVSDHRSNSLFTGHAEWLHRAGISLAQLSSCKPLSAHFSAKHEVVKRHLDREVAATRAMLRKEWEKQRGLFVNKQERVNATGAYPLCFSEFY